MIARRNPKAPDRYRSTRHVAALLMVLALTLTGTGCKKKPKPFPPAPKLALAPVVDAGLVPVSVTPTAAAPVDPLSPADRAAFEQTKASVTALEAMVKRQVLTNPDKPEDDANAKCAGVEETLPRLESLDDPEAKKLAADAKRLCSYEVPVISADHTLKHVTISPSQASRQLMCKYASKDIDKARAAKPNDRRVRDLEARFGRACR